MISEILSGWHVLSCFDSGVFKLAHSGKIMCAGCVVCSRLNISVISFPLDIKSPQPPQLKRK